jgi:5-oxopent-3-ene-1,2,5-tricarboxylate decarboxylase/2-hydroxyhepta-2,4-diene-1,7-dioate isomerase
VRRARIAHGGRALWASVAADGATLALADGTVVDAAGTEWLPPVSPGASIYALGLNYAAHSAELGFAKPEAEPLVFMKGHATLVGHGGTTPRPQGARQMHPECELVAVMGRPARGVSAADALGYVGGYTVANDYAVREYLENYYRPNARVKNRDASTPLGPWVVDAADVGDPQSLALTTTVNGAVVQRGDTSGMIRGVAALVEYLSSFLTLLPGDLILTGTPEGVHFVAPGDRVVCEIARVGALANTITEGA